MFILSCIITRLIWSFVWSICQQGKPFWQLEASNSPKLTLRFGFPFPQGKSKNLQDVDIISDAGTKPGGPWAHYGLVGKESKRRRTAAILASLSSCLASSHICNSLSPFHLDQILVWLCTWMKKKTTFFIVHESMSISITHESYSFLALATISEDEKSPLKSHNMGATQEAVTLFFL